MLMNWAKQHASFGGKLVLDWDRLHGQFSEERKPQIATQDTEALSSATAETEKEEAEVRAPA